jgi:subtilisin family serine protease
MMEFSGISGQERLSAGFNSRIPGREDFPGQPIAELAQDTFKPMTADNSQYIILPPKEMAHKSLFKAVESHLEGFHVKVEEKLPIIGGYLANLDENKKADLTKAGYMVFEDREENWIPGPMDNPPVKEGEKAKEDESVQLIERPKLTEPRFDTPLTRQYQGEGITIAVIDTGIYPHPDLATPGEKNRIIDFVDFVNGKKLPYDDGGHGTHVAGDAAGNGFLSDGLHKGPAPKANLIGLKALKGQGGGQTSDVVKAIQWCIQNKEKHNIRIINMSLGHTAQEDYQNDPTNLAVKKAYEAGIVVVASAGNNGPAEKSIKSPGDSPHSITVGAADDNNTPRDPSDDKVTDFSSRGPTAGGLAKPDIIAPGEAIIAPFSPGTESGARRSSNLFETLKWLNTMPDEALTQIPAETLRLYGLADTTIEKWMTSPTNARKEMKRIFRAVQKTPMVDEAYVGKPGTSMAAPIVSGIVAQMLQANPNLTPGEVAQILKMTADKLPGEVPYGHQGHGMVDPHEAIQIALDVKEGNLEILPPQIQWPT